MERYHIIIIGAGIAGLTCGCYLAKAGFKVLIVEQHYKAGGYCSSFERNGYKFDVGVHYLGGIRRTFLKHILKELELNEEIQFCQFDPTDKLVMPDRVTYVRANPFETIIEFKNSFREEKNNLEAFFNFIMQEDFYQIYKKVKRLNFQNVLDSFFKDYKLKTTLEILLCNFGLPAKRMSALTGIILYRDYILDGGYYPTGGMQGFTNAFVHRYKSYGGELLLCKKVKRIVTQDGEVKGVVLDDGGQLQADIVVSNADATLTFKKLLKNYHCKENPIIDKMQVSPSLFVMYIGTDQNIDEFTKETCNIWSADTYQFGQHIADLNKSVLIQRPPFIMINFPSAHVNENSGKNTIQFFLIAPFKSKRFWDSYKTKLSEKILARTEKILPRLRNHIKIRLTATPHSFLKYTLNKNGAAFGWASTVNQVRSTLFPPRASIERLFLTGHWCTIGSGQGGVPKAIFSGRKTAQLILSTLGK